MKTIIINVIVVTMDVQRNVYTDGYVKIEGTKITEVGPAGSLKDTKEELERTGWEIRDGQRGILMPGMINTHCHLGMVPFRGLGDDCKDRLRVFLLPMEQKAMDRDMAALSSRYAICELLLCGVTTVMDMYYFEESVAAVMDQTGIRGIAGQTVMDEGGCDAPDADTALGKARELIEAYKHHPRISGCAAPHATNTCSPQSLKKAWEMDRRNHVPFTLHAAEMDYELTWLAKTFGCTPIEYLDRTGVLDSHTAAAHGIHLTDGDISLLKQKGSGISHCIGSNAKAAKGVAPVLKLLKEGVPVGLGTDWISLPRCACAPVFRKTRAATAAPCPQRILYPWRPVRAQGFWGWIKKPALLSREKRQIWCWLKRIPSICFPCMTLTPPWFILQGPPMSGMCMWPEPAWCGIRNWFLRILCLSERS